MWRFEKSTMPTDETPDEQALRADLLTRLLELHAHGVPARVFQAWAKDCAGTSFAERLGITREEGEPVEAWLSRVSRNVVFMLRREPEEDVANAYCRGRSWTREMPAFTPATAEHVLTLSSWVFAGQDGPDIDPFANPLLRSALAVRLREYVDRFSAFEEIAELSTDDHMDLANITGVLDDYPHRDTLESDNDLAHLISEIGDLSAFFDPPTDDAYWSTRPDLWE